MEIPFHQKLAAKARKSHLFAFILAGLYFVWEALTHKFFAWFDEKAIEATSSSFPLIGIVIMWILTHPLWLIGMLGGGYCVILVVWALLPRRRPAVEIINVRQGDTVDYRQVICGAVRNPKVPLQLFVQPLKEGRWYPQWKPEIYGKYWRAMCQFGSADSSGGGSYTVIAISGHVVDGVLSRLPDSGTKSEPVRVQRSPKQTAEYAPGIYLGRTRHPFKVDEWMPYTPKTGTVTIEQDYSIRFTGRWENGSRYPREDTTLGPATIFGLRFKPGDEVNFYAHFRSVTVFLSSRFPEWGLDQAEFRVALPPSMLERSWHTVFLFLPSLEQSIRKRLDNLQRFSVRGSLNISPIHEQCFRDEVEDAVMRR
jgi:hypothetical protein